MTLEEMKELNLPIEATDCSLFYVSAGLAWLQENTTLDINLTDMDTIKVLPAGVKLFLCKFSEVMQSSGAITSESIGGMSQSFSDKDQSSILFSIARALIGDKYLKSQLHSVPHISNWR